MHSRETDLAYVVAVLETKAGLDLVGCDALLNAEDLTIEARHGAMWGNSTQLL